MDLLFLEALGAGLVFVFIVWWTMFSGRRSGEPRSRDELAAPTAPATGDDSPR